MYTDDNCFAIGMIQSAGKSELQVIVGILSELVLIFICFVVSNVFPLLELVMEGVGTWFGRDDFSAVKVRAIGGEMLGFVFVADVTEILGAFELVMPFFLAVVAGGGGVVYVIAVMEGFFRRSV
ncbi:hypothetical protein EV424DRAFT_1345886 [Suillus variegatus]|nr:hypothetical protein EV424DRAFT_1345886 [Suillus variegatus]